MNKLSTLNLLVRSTTELTSREVVAEWIYFKVGEHTVRTKLKLFNLLNLQAPFEVVA